MTVDTRQSAEFLHGLGYLYCRGGNRDRGLVFLLLAARIAPEDTGILRTLATVFLETGAADRALSAIEKISAIEGEGATDLQLLKSRALWLNGENAGAHRAFLDYLKNRTAA
ncbi:tetratricopeptide repeat protein [Phyllobacterium phragmitis]|uniref:Type III secretion protein n=1 Tax=Phyllobacterium phragmitis TaxID=2670329 RepID=A0ABQ0H4U3_9HYPH